MLSQQKSLQCACMTTSLEIWLMDLRDELITHFKPEFLGRPSAVFNFEFDDDPPFYLAVVGNDFFFKTGKASDFTIKLFISNHQTLRDLLTGKADGMQAFMDNQYRSDGNIVLSQLLLYLFKPDRPTIAYEVRD
mgnify:CR=1 FL=1